MTLQQPCSARVFRPGRLDGMSVRLQQTHQAIRPQLVDLGAIGLERRLQRLQQEEGLFDDQFLRDWPSGGWSWLTPGQAVLVVPMARCWFVLLYDVGITHSRWCS